ncbi:hypothetical protein IMSAG049_01550 [Clostridiales bacterium]|nr:hypothetical protein IMSAG049_01550 [Clostridiales bacterium]
MSVDKIYLLVLIPIIVAFVIFLAKKHIKKDRYVNMSTALRLLTIAALILAMSGISIVDRAKDETTLFLADISDSTKNSSNKIAEFIETAQEYKGNGDKTAVSLFAGRTINTIPPTNEYVTVNMDAAAANKENTNIEAGIKQAITAYGNDTKKRMVIITDGSETKGDAVSARNILKSENIQTLIYDVSRGIEHEAGIREIALPQYVNINMDYDVNVIIDSIGSQKASLRLYRGSTVVVNEQIDLKHGENRYVFSDRATNGGGITYHAEITSQNDTFYQNNSVYGYCYAENLPSVLVIGTGESAENMKNILQSAQLNVDVLSPLNAPSAYDSLIAYDTVVICDTEYSQMSEEFITALDSFVKYAGGGLITIGGENSYGPGGYSGTPIEDMLPIEMEIKTQSEKPDLAMIMVIDRSGSMSDGSYGLSSMDLAKEAAFRGVQELDENDMVGIVAFDSQGQWIVEPKKVGENLDSISDAIGTIQAGGGTSILPALRMACSKLADIDTKLKHIILLTDGQAETEGYSGLLAQARNDGITISTIGVGQGADATLLQYIADAGKGRYYYADQSASLPEIFVYETTVASKDYINNEDFYPSIGDSSEITENVDSVPMLHGYVSSTAKGRADVILKSDKDEPVLAAWQYGLGRSAAWLSDMSGQWSSDWLGADEGLEIMRNLISYSMRSDVLYDIEVSGETSNGVSVITTKLPVNKNTAEVSAIVKTSNGEEFYPEMIASLPGEYKGTIPIDEEGAYIITVTEALSDGGENVYNTGFIIGYSGEYDTRKLNDNGVIDELASYEGISLITSPAEVYSTSLPDTYAKRDITVNLIVLALIFLILDIFIRRFPELTDKVVNMMYKLKPKQKSKALFSDTLKNSPDKKSEDKKIEERQVTEKSAETNVQSKSSSSTLANRKRNRRR